MDDVLVNLASTVPAFFSRFNRVAELVGNDEAARAAARERYRFYQERGYTLNTHKL
jgi:DNA polymerase-3 subunit chi